MCIYTVSSLSFNIGLRFYYWDYYKSLKELPDVDIPQYNINDHSGYDISDLYVPPKYASFKEEIRSYQYIEFKQYEEEVVVKAKEHENTRIVKETKAALGRWDGTEGLHYDIKDGVPLGFPNLVSLILYTDYTELSSHFTATFRRSDLFESLKSIKTRNSDYYWMSRRLRETVEIFGGCSNGDSYADYKNKLRGSYYCGMSVELNIPEFNIFLCSPTSTSKQIEVAIKFSGHHGIVIQLDNPPTDQYKRLRGFNCCWLSRFKEEDERY